MPDDHTHAHNCETPRSSLGFLPLSPFMRKGKNKHFGKTVQRNMNCTCLRNNSGPGGAKAALSGPRRFFPPFNCVWLHSVKSTWWQLKAATGQNSSSASTVECVTRNRPQRSFYFLCSCFFFFFCFFLFVTAVQAELLPGLLHSLTFSHHKDKGRRPLKKLDIRDTFICLCAPFLAWLSFFFFFFILWCTFFFPVVSSGPVREKGRRGSEAPAWPLVWVVVLDRLLAELREWSDVPREAVQQPQVGSHGPRLTSTETRSQCNSITMLAKVKEVLQFLFWAWCLRFISPTKGMMK